MQIAFVIHFSFLLSILYLYVFFLLLFLHSFHGFAFGWSSIVYVGTIFAGAQKLQTISIKLHASLGHGEA